MANTGTFGVGSSGGDGWPFTGVCQVFSFDCNVISEPPDMDQEDDADACGDVGTGVTLFPLTIEVWRQ